MLAEWRGLEYAFEILRVLNNQDSLLDSKQINSLIKTDARIESTLSYVQKILPRMVKIGLLQSSAAGYRLAKPINQIMVDNVLEICTMPDEISPLNKVCDQIKAALSLTSVDEFYNFD